MSDFIKVSIAKRLLSVLKYSYFEKIVCFTIENSTETVLGRSRISPYDSNLVIDKIRFKLSTKLCLKRNLFERNKLIDEQ